MFTTNQNIHSPPCLHLSITSRNHRLQQKQWHMRTTWQNVTNYKFEINSKTHRLQQMQWHTRTSQWNATTRRNSRLAPEIITCNRCNGTQWKTTIMNSIPIRKIITCNNHNGTETKYNNKLTNSRNKQPMATTSNHLQNNLTLNWPNPNKNPNPNFQ